MNFLQTAWSDIKHFLGTVEADIKWLGHEFTMAVGWVDKTVPGAQAAIANLIQKGDVAAQNLVAIGAKGLSDVTGAAIDDAGSFIANVISASGASPGVKTELSALDVNGILTAHAIAENALHVATAKALSGLATAAQYANKANAPATVTAPTQEAA